MARNKQKTEEVAAELEKEFKVTTKCIIFDFDVSYEDSLLDVLQVQLEALSDISVLVNNVGCAYAGNIVSHPNEKIRSMVRTNIFSQVFMSKLVMPLLLKR
jgi:short-subunit dehydrogenase